MNKQEVLKHISVDPDIMHGRPCVAGTRIPVWLVIGMLGDGMSETDILEQYPSLSETDLKACLKYASFVVDYETMEI